MSACSTCGQTPCSCAPAVLSGIQLVNSLLSNPTIDGMTANGGAATNLSLVGAQIDCTSRGCTAGAGVCNDGIATNAQVCAVVAAAISSGNPAFCTAVGECIQADPSALCVAVAACINSTPGIINSTSSFGFNARATTALFGVARYATLAEFNNGNCLLAVDPCTLIAALTTPALGSPFFTAFAGAVNTVVAGSGLLCSAVDACLATSAALCTAVSACGFAPLNNPIFTGDPRVPTPLPGDSDTSIASTFFVQNAISTAISGSNPAFCAAVTACGGAASAGVAGSVNFPTFLGGPLVLFQQGCSILPDAGANNLYQVTFTLPRANTNYAVVYGNSQSTLAFLPAFGTLLKTAAGFIISGGTGEVSSYIADFAVIG